MSRRPVPPDRIYRDKYRGPEAVETETLKETQDLVEIRHFDPENRRSHKEDPHANVRRFVPEGFRLEKDYSLSSEFNRELDQGVIRVPTRQRKRWTTNNKWRGRYPAMFKDENVTFQNDGAVFHVRRSEIDAEFEDVFKKDLEGPNEYRLNEKITETLEDRKRERRDVYKTSFLKSENTITFGYFEIACRLGDSALSSAFWLKEHEKSRREIDVFEYSTSGRTDMKTVPFENYFLTNFHVFSNPDKAKHGVSSYQKKRDIDMQTNLSKKDIVVGLLWTEDRLFWFLNNQLVREVRHGGIFDSTCKMHVQLDREYLPMFGEPEKDDRMGEFHVYYVRSWRLKRTAASRIARALTFRGLRKEK